MPNATHVLGHLETERLLLVVHCRFQWDLAATLDYCFETQIGYSVDYGLIQVVADSISAH